MALINFFWWKRWNNLISHPLKLEIFLFKRNVFRKPPLSELNRKYQQCNYTNALLKNRFHFCNAHSLLDNRIIEKKWKWKPKRKKLQRTFFFPFVLSPSDLSVLKSYVLFCVSVSQALENKRFSISCAQNSFFSWFLYLHTE